MGFFDAIKSIFGDRVDVAKRFETIKKANYGTMSKFLIVRDRKNDNRICGLKIIDMEKLKQVEARWVGQNKPSEGEISSRFNHPYIAKTFEYGMTTQNENYILFEYLEGLGMNTMILNHPNQLDGRRLMFLRQGAEAIQTVHDAGFIHRDICPRNFLLNSDGSVMKLTDFGLSVPASGVFLQPGNRTGTPNYMAPELVRRRPTDQRLDIFAYGMTMYEIMTGDLPWPRGATGQAAMSHDTPPVPLLELKPNADPVLAAAIMSCIESNPNKRCPTMKHFLQQIKYVRAENVL